MAADSSDSFDLAVVGSGPGGYVAAIRAAQLGMRVAVIEEDRPGGVCLNWGCIPSKALLTGAELVETLQSHGDTFGVSAAGGLELDYAKVQVHSRKVADRLCKGVQGLLKKNQITLLAGRGRLAGPGTVAVEGPDATQVRARRVLLATGSTELVLPGMEVDGEHVVTSREALATQSVPGSVVVIGAGAVGVEFAYVWAMYGAKVTLVEMADQMLPGSDKDVAAALAREFRRKKIDVHTGTKFEELKVNGDKVRVATSGGKAPELEADRVLIALGRRPLSKDLGLETAGVEVDERGFVKVDARLATTGENVWAIGDLVGAPLLAHKASEEGVAAVEWMAGMERPPLDHEKIPGCIYAQPQVAWIGLTEAQARERHGDDIRVGTFPFTASGKALAAAHTAGFVKVIAEPKYGEIVGAHLVGQGATELVAELGLAMTLECTTAEIAGTTHAHPTLSEAIHEAALLAEGRGINF